ncbi:MAG: hypothetical protein HY015_09970 [Bacteroidetes bacterium]|nr:hypothetical protein [Bacteroidota bacterium]MBI3483277.1 hypothetical protein [Bacteroidota bacterium]
MNKLKIGIIVLSMLFVSRASAQKIFMYKTFGGVIYMLNDSVELSTRQTKSLLFSHQKAYAEFQKAKTWSTVSAITGFTGAAMVAIPLATVAFGEKADWGYAAGGGALIAIGMISNWIYKGRAIDAIDLYNADLPQKTSRIKPELQFYGTGASLVIRF